MLDYGKYSWHMEQYNNAFYKKDYVVAGRWLDIVLTKLKTTKLSDLTIARFNYIKQLTDDIGIKKTALKAYMSYTRAFGE